MKILLAIDDSASSREAIRSVSARFRKEGTELRVLHVVEPIAAYISAELIPHFVPRVAKVEEDRRKQAQELVQHAARQLRKTGFKASEVVDEGDPKAKIIDQAAKWNADLIVVGSHGWKGLNRFLLGSVSESVVRHAGCSVEVVRLRGRAKPSRTERAKRSR
jgi:nucleotide-binding universal stress UspA family protein